MVCAAILHVVQLVLGVYCCSASLAILPTISHTTPKCVMNGYHYVLSPGSLLSYSSYKFIRILLSLPSAHAIKLHACHYE